MTKVLGYLIQSILILSLFASVGASANTSASGPEVDILADNDEQFDVQETVNDLNQFIAEVKVYIEKMGAAKQKYQAVMEPSQKLVAQCKTSQSMRLRHVKARKLLSFTCKKFKNELKKRLYDVANILKESQVIEEQMIEEAKFVASALSATDVATELAKPLEKLNRSISQLTDLRSKLTSELNTTFGE